MCEISDKIRKWCGTCRDSCIDEDDCDGLRDLADRVDAETVELPKSADGKIWTGREVCFWTGATEGDWHDFNSLVYINGKWCVEDKHWQRYPAASAWYERPDSLERIADELDEMVDAADSADDRCEKLADLAERIRRLAAKEG
jgi:hypothetical protein